MRIKWPSRFEVGNLGLIVRTGTPRRGRVYEFVFDRESGEWFVLRTRMDAYRPADVERPKRGRKEAR